MIADRMSRTDGMDLGIGGIKTAFLVNECSVDEDGTK